MFLNELEYLQIYFNELPFKLINIIISGAQCPWDGYNGRQAIFDYIACRDETGARLSTPSKLGHFRKLDDFQKFPEGVPEGTWCLKMRCNSRNG